MSSEENIIHRKAFLDHLWFLSMSQMIDVMAKNGGLKPPSDFDIANKLNKEKIEHQDEAQSSKQMFLDEVSGYIMSYRDLLADMMEDLFQKTTGKTISENEAREHRAKTKLEVLIYHLFRLDKVGKAMPTIRIFSALHAAVRWDKAHKFQGHDTHDFHHATTALPYCENFFTDKRLAHLVTQKKLSFYKLYGCVVHSKLSNAIASLEKLQQEKA